MAYTITFARSARKELERMDRKLGLRILDKIETLSAAPRSPGCKKLQGEDNLWRIRIGDYRVIYSIDDKQKIVDVSAVRHRREIYR